MTNTITENYSFWVTMYSQQKKGRYIKEAQRLDEAIKKMTSIEEIYNFLFNPTSLPRGLIFFPSEYSEDLYCKRVAALKNLVLKLRTCQQSNIIDSVEQMAVSQAMRGLISLIKKTLTHPRVFFFGDSVSLSRQVTDLDLLHRIINHLERLPIQLPPKDPKPGSFEAVKPFDDDHAFCLGLLRNNSVVYENSEVFTEANIFLQSLLSVYQATYAIKIEVAHPFEMEAEPPVERICPTCSIL